MAPGKSDNQSQATRPPNKAYDKKRGKKKFRKPPHCMYFYYINPSPPAGQDTIQHYYVTNDNEVIEQEDVEELIIKLIKNARGQLNDPPQCGSGDKHLVWTRKSYIVFAVEDSNFTFDNDDAFDFYDPTFPNTTFFDADDSAMTVDGRRVAICYCINHMKRSDDADDIGSENKPVRFWLKGNPPLLFFHLPDSGGTNQGPGVPPPE